MYTFRNHDHGSGSDYDSIIEICVLNSTTSQLGLRKQVLENT